MKNKVLENIREVFIEIFDDIDLEIGFSTSAKDIEEWDSLMNLQIMLAIEKKFKVSFTAAEISNFANIGEICDCIVKKRRRNLKFVHIGVACDNIETEIENIKKIHKINSISDIVFDEKQNATLCMLNIENGLNIELISGKIIENIVKKGIKYYHLCYEVVNMEEELRKMGDRVKAISDIKEAILFDRKKVIFLMTSYGLIELVEKN